jgi:hypothetical protein
MTERIVPRPYPNEEPVQPRPGEENEEEHRESDLFDDEDDDVDEDAVSLPLRQRGSRHPARYTLQRGV